MSTINPVQRDEYLTNMLINFVPDQTPIGLELMPRYGVEKRTGYYYKADADLEGMRLENDVIARRTATPEVTNDLSEAPFGPLVKRGLKQFIDEEDIEAHGSLDKARAGALRNIAGKMVRRHEKIVADMLTDTAVITNYQTLTGSDKFSDFANSNPVNVIDDILSEIKEDSGYEANTCAMPENVWKKVRRHPDLLGLLSVSSLRRLTPEMFADIFSLEKVLISNMQYNSAKKGQTASKGYIWGKHMFFGYINPSAGEVIDSPTIGRTFYKRDSYFVDGWSVTDPDGEYVRTHDFYDVMTVVTDCGGVIKDVIA